LADMATLALVVGPLPCRQRGLSELITIRPSFMISIVLSRRIALMSVRTSMPEGLGSNILSNILLESVCTGS